MGLDVTRDNANVSHDAASYNCVAFVRTGRRAERFTRRSVVGRNYYGSGLGQGRQRFAVRAQFSVQRLGHLAQNAPLSAPISIPSRSRQRSLEVGLPHQGP